MKISLFKTRLLTAVAVVFSGLNVSAQTLPAGYAVTTMAAPSSGTPTQFAVNFANGDLYYSDQSGSTNLSKITLNGVVSIVNASWTQGLFHHYWAADIEYANDSIYSYLSSSPQRLIRASVNGSGAVTGFNGPSTSAAETGMAIVGNYVYMTDGNGSSINGIIRFDRTNNSFIVLNTGQYPEMGTESLEYCAANNTLYLSVANGTNGNLYSINQANGIATLINTGGVLGAGNIAIDPFGQYAYTSTANQINRIDLTTGVSTVFGTGFASSYFGVLAFGPALGGGYNLYMGGNGPNIYKISGFGANGLNFDGTDDYVVSATNVDITGNQPRTIEYRARLDNAYDHHVNWGGTGFPIPDGSSFGMYMTGGFLHFYNHGASGTFDHNTGFAADGNYHHVAVTYDGTTVRTYVDGNPTPFPTAARNLNTTNGRLYIGVRQDLHAPTFTPGTIDEVRVWNRALCQGEIQSHMSCELAGTETGLRIYYKFNHGIASQPNPGIVTTTDHSPNGNNGALNTFALTGATSNWVVGMVNGSCAAFNGPATPTASSNTPVCSGSPINLSTPTVAGATYSWTGPNSYTSSVQNPSFTATMAAAGTYSVTVTVGGCSSAVGTTAVVVTQTPAPAASNSGPYCPGSTINLTTPFIAGATYSWTGPNLFTSTLQSPSAGGASALTVGTYSVTVTSGGCSSAAGTTTVALQPAINITPGTPTHVSCFGGSNGTASITASGGGGSFSYNWNPGIPTGDGTNSVTGLIAGTWTVTVTDANTCTANQTITITQPNLLVASAGGQTNILCNGANIGTATVSVAGGTPGYTYLWSNGQTTQTATGLIAGVYTVTVTDSKGCTATQSFTITQPSALTVQASSQVDIACFGGTGSATATIVGGTGAINYNWTPGNPPGDGTNTVTGLIPGTYTITATDANGCTVAHTYNFVQPALLTATPAAQTNVSCNGGANGTATVTVAGGTGTKTYNWTPGNPIGEGTNSVSGLTAGTWTVTVTDANLCVATQTFTITQPNALVVTPASQTNVLCNGAATGAASVTATGGTGAYSYNWTPGNPTGDGTNSVTGLTAGTWTVTVTDVNLCSTTQTFTITQPNAIVVTPVSQTNVACNGGATGTASVTATGGNGTLTYNWTPGNPTGDGTNSVTGLTVGTWTVTVTDANLCSTTQTFNITQQSSLVTSVSGQVNVSCFGGNNGTATVNVSGGTGPGTYNYSWTPGTGNAATVSSLSANTYTVTVTDGNNCSVTQNVTITQPAVLAGTQSQTNVTCNGANNGITTVTPAGGTTPYTYLWSPNGGTAATATGRAPGAYSVLVTDAKGCTMVKSYTITQPATLVASAAAQTNVSCFGTATGSATVGVTGGTTGYTYSWAPSGGTAATANGLAMGTYTVTVTDANLCTTTQTFNITQPALLVASITSQTNVSCFGGNNGTVTVGATGGTAPYGYSWAPSGGTAATASGLAMGTYVATITDAHGCITTQTVNITQPSVLATSIASQTNVSCNGGTNGAATVTVTGGAGAYTYSWSPSGGTAATATGLTAGAYTLTATDANGCTVTQAVNITQPAVLAGTPSQTNVSCNSANDGTATISVTGGTTPYDYSWAPSGGTAATANGLAPGTYTVTVTDDNGCEITNSYTITQPATLTAAMSSNVPCQGNTLNLTSTVAGGTTPYSYSWTGANSFTGSSANPSITNVPTAAAGAYTLTVTDDNGCTATATGTVVINHNALVTVQPVATTACIGSPAGFSVTATGTGLTYQWRANGVNIPNGGVYSGATTNTLSISDASGLNNMSYDVVVTGTCTTVTSAAAILGTPTTNTWTGIADTAWSNPMNWQCGNIPNININVVIPSSAPHMPLVDIPGAVARSITVNAGATLAFVGTGNQVEVTGDITNLGSFNASLGAVKLSGNNAQSLPGGTYKQLKVDGSDVKSIQGNVTIVSNLMLTNGYIKLGNNSFTMSNTALLTGGSDASYIITDGSGQVITGNMGVGGNITPVVFPVGTEDVYLPATISNAGTTDVYGVRVIDDVYDDYSNNEPTGNVVTQNVVDKTWIITEAADGGSNANVSLSWTGAEELTGFINIECHIAHFNENTSLWEPGVVGTATNNAGRFTTNRPNVTSFSPFSVRTEPQVNSVIKSPTFAYGLILYPNPVVDNKLYIRMSDQSLSTAMDIVVVDMLGKVVSNQHYNAGSYKADNIEVNIGDVAAGNYMLKLKQEGAVPQAVKFTKK